MISFFDMFDLTKATELSLTEVDRYPVPRDVFGSCGNGKPHIDSPPFEGVPEIDMVMR